MCGIAGYVTPVDGPCPDHAVLRQMLGMVRHRGPDQFGIYLGRRAGLGSARLSILDVAGGQQPIGNEDGTLWIVFNGEIFNYRDLRSDLESRGHRFTTHTDTEVLLHLFEERGKDCLDLLNGQFACAIWDERRQSLFLARDRLGVRPLFYTRNAGTVIFGSEIKALLAYPGMEARLDPLAVREVFTYWSPLPPRTCFQGVFQVPPGHYAEVHDGKIEIRPWWQLEFHEAQGERSLDDWVDELRWLLRDATRLRLQADVPVGAYLSGGLDSSLIASIACQLGVSRLDTFSISFSDPRYDETQYQRQMAKFLGTEHQVAYATDHEIGVVFPEMVWHSETPVLRTAPAPMFMLSKLVRDCGCKVVLTGEGADEFFAGYDIFKEDKIRRFWSRQPDSRWRPSLLRRLYADIPGLRRANLAYLTPFFGRGLCDVRTPGYSHAIRWQNGQRLQRFFSDEMTGCPDDRSVPFYPGAFSGWDALQQAQFIEISTFLSHYLLSSQGDRPAMAHSVEGRYPFLDKRVVEFCTRLPSRLKLRGLREKYILRKMAEDHIPVAIAARAKRPYRAPIRRCFFNESSPDYVQEALSPRSVAEAGMFKAAAVEQLARKARSSDTLGETDEMALVGILSSQLLFRQFVASFRTSRQVSSLEELKIVDRRSAPVCVQAP